MRRPVEGTGSRMERRLVPLVLALALGGLAVGCTLAPDGLAPPPQPGRLVEVGPGLRLNVFDEGAASLPAIVLVHGCPGSAYDWEALAETLAGHGLRVIRYDRVGYGHSDRRVEDADHTLAANARELIGLLDTLSIERATLVGWSYGGGVVQLVAQQAPERVHALVLTGSLTHHPRERGWRILELMLYASEPLNNWALENGYGRSNLVRTLEEAFNGPPPEGWVDRTAALMALPGTGHAWITEMKLAQPEFLTPELLDLPVVVIHGEDDQTIPFEHAVALHGAISGARLIAVEAGSHMLPATHPDVLAQAIQSLLE